jgi:mono/diheme cytochrome c family protein
MRHVLTPILGCAWAAILAATIAAQTAGDPAAKKMKNPVAATPDSIKEGQQLFQKYCRFCHGADAKGNGPMAPKGTHPPDLTDAEWTTGSSDGEIFAVIRDGTGPKQEMKPFKSKMTAQEMWHVVNYLRSIGPTTKQP